LENKKVKKVKKRDQNKKNVKKRFLHLWLKQRASHIPQTAPPVMPPAELLYARAIFLSPYTQLHYAQHDVMNIQHAHCGLV